MILITGKDRQLTKLHCVCELHLLLKSLGGFYMSPLYQIHNIYLVKEKRNLVLEEKTSSVVSSYLLFMENIIQQQIVKS